MTYIFDEIIKQTDKNIIVVGLGKSGSACIRYLVDNGIKPIVMDSRNNPPLLTEIQELDPNIKIVLGNFDEEYFKNASLIILSPGVSLKEPALLKAAAQCIPIIGEVELFAQKANAPVLAITGSNGKSTVTTLLGEMLKKAGLRVAIGGNLGTPAIDLLCDPAPDYYVLELSSFQLETVFSLDAKGAVILNISEDHMDRYENINEYTQAKKRILRSYGLVVVNKDDTTASILSKDVASSRSIINYSLSHPLPDEFGILEKDGIEYLAFGDDAIMASSDIKLPGRHNISNALAAMALGKIAGINYESMVATLKEFAGLPHRTEWVAEINGVNWYNDSKATNVGATIAAIKGMPGSLILIMGGDGKGADFGELASVIKNKVKGVVLIGRDATLIEKAIKDITHIEYAKDLNEAVKKCTLIATCGDSVMLSPACASWDMFCGGYEQRGLLFAQEVRELAK